MTHKTHTPKKKLFPEVQITVNQNYIRPHAYYHYLRTILLFFIFTFLLHSLKVCSKAMCSTNVMTELLPVN